MAERERCRWIEGDPGAVLMEGEAVYCGAPVSSPGSAWCSHHRAICYPPNLTKPAPAYLMRRAA